MRKDMDDILKQALTPTEEPDFWLNQKILHQAEERKMTDNRKKADEKKRIKRIPVVLSAVLVLGLGSVTAAAAWKYLTPDKAAEQIQDEKLASAFRSKDAISINETQSGGGYDVTLLGILSGKDLTDFAMEANGEIKKDRTYAVTAIEKSDGTPMPETSEDAYGEETFFVSPLIKGYAPDQYNAFTMNGGYSDVVKDGILYRISECDNVEIFADHEIYLSVSDGTFYNPEAYSYNEKSGVISRNKDYKGLNALFTLPLDEKKADAGAVKKYLRQMEKDLESSEEEEDQKTEEDLWMSKITPQNIEQYAKRVESTVQTVTPDEQGRVYTSYELEDGSGGEGFVVMENLFEDDTPGMSPAFNYSYSDGGVKSLKIDTYTLNEDGTVTYAVYVPK